MRKFLTIVSLALLLVTFGAASWGQAGHSKAHQLQKRVTKLEQQVQRLYAQGDIYADRVVAFCPDGAPAIWVVPEDPEVVAGQPLARLSC